jgi:hypothetical protein
VSAGQIFNAVGWAGFPALPPLGEVLISSLCVLILIGTLPQQRPTAASKIKSSETLSKGRKNRENPSKSVKIRRNKLGFGGRPLILLTFLKRKLRRYTTYKWRRSDTFGKERHPGPCRKLF